MYKIAVTTLVSYIKNIFPDLAVFDANYKFNSPDNYALIYILNLKPTTPHENLKNETSINQENQTKVFTFKESTYLDIRIDFRGSSSYENIATFKSSFLKEKNKEFLKEAGFGFFGINGLKPLVSLRDTKAKEGMTITLKLMASNLVTDESQIIKTFDLDVQIVNKI